jgi:hypothetical protein
MKENAGPSHESTVTPQFDYVKANEILYSDKYYSILSCPQALRQILHRRWRPRRSPCHRQGTACSQRGSPWPPQANSGLSI